MKKTFVLFSILISIVIYSCDILESVKESTEVSVNSSLTQQEVANGLKEALNTGIINTVLNVSQVNGFYNNPEIKIPFPQEAIKVKEVCEKAGLKNQITDFEEKLNRAAEDASKEARDVFIESIKQMSINDAISILKGNDDDATQYLKKTTSTRLYEKVYPIVVNSTNKIALAKYWSPLADKYNAVVSITGGERLTTDLNSYITNKTLDGLFIMVAKEEKKIRTEPLARVNDILKRVFGSNLNPYNSK